MRWIIFVLFIGVSQAEETLQGSHIYETRGYELRDFSLSSPFNTLHSAWTPRGDAVVSNNRISLTRLEPSMKGSIWSNNKLSSRDWEMHLSVNSHGGSGNLHAEGIALWYVNEPSEGEVFGAGSNFKGIGVIVDTYENGLIKANFPRISIVLNDGTKKFDWDKDGENLIIGESCGGIVFHNNDVNAASESKSFRLLLRYFNENLELYYAGYDDTLWKVCTTVKGIRLPINYAIGVSSSTGELVGHHDVQRLKVYELDGAIHSLPPAISPEYAAQVEQAPQLEKQEGMGTWSKIGIFFLVVLALSGSAVFYKFYWQPKVHQRKRFY